MVYFASRETEKGISNTLEPIFIGRSLMNTRIQAIQPNKTLEGFSTSSEDQETMQIMMKISQLIESLLNGL
jgi:hypothetical protein